MCTNNELQTILDVFTQKASNLFSSKLKGIILFGSYARGDYDNESDIDIMLLVDMEKTEMKKYRSQIVDITTDIDWQYDIVLSPILQNFDEFEEYKDASGFFKNILKEGVIVHA